MATCGRSWPMKWAIRCFFGGGLSLDEVIARVLGHADSNASHDQNAAGYLYQVGPPA